MFLLGAYPSALHVAWRPPARKPVRAMAVDNEPTPFWNGADEDERIAQWKAAVGSRDGEWGEVTGVGDLNGSSGTWVDDNVLAPLGVGRDAACITDCIDTYFASEGGAARVADTCVPFVKTVGLPVPRLAPHPSEGAIVDGAPHALRLLDLELAQGHVAVPERDRGLRGAARVHGFLW